MSRWRSQVAGYTLVELLVVIVGVAILGLGVYKLLGFDGCSEAGTPVAVVDDGKLPGKVHEVCIAGFLYYYVQSRWEGYARAGLAPKWDDDGRPARCFAGGERE